MCRGPLRAAAVKVQVGPLTDRLTAAEGKIRVLEATNKELTDHKKELQEDMLMSAAVLGDERMLQTLLRQTGNSPDFALPGTHRRSLLWNAASEGRLDVVDYLLEAGAEADLTCTETDTTPLFMASQEGHYKVVETLISKGADVNSASGVDETTPIIVASQNGHLRVVELLVDTGADCNARTTDDGLTALLAASNQGHTAIVARLIKDGADVDAALFIDDGSYQKTGPTSLMQAGPVNLHSIHALFAFLPFVSHCFIFCNERLYALCFNTHTLPVLYIITRRAVHAGIVAQ